MLVEHSSIRGALKGAHSQQLSIFASGGTSTSSNGSRSSSSPRRLISTSTQTRAHSAIQHPAKSPRVSTTTSRFSPAGPSHHNAFTTPVMIQRFPSSSSSTPSSTSSNSSSSSSSPTSSTTGLTWNQFLQLRKTRRRYNLVSSVTTGAGTAFTGAGFLATQDLNQISNVLFGIDPFMAMGLSTLACGAIGWLLGPIAGSAVFNVLHRSSSREMLQKEKDFFHRIQKYRADITAGGNLQNTPFPDYYGEKIDSVAAYRQWLRDQRKFSKKREYRAK